jgi:hypothetical protein
MPPPWRLDISEARSGVTASGPSGGGGCYRGRVGSAQMVVRLMSVSSSIRRPGTS